MQGLGKAYRLGSQEPVNTQHFVIFLSQIMVGNSPIGQHGENAWLVSPLLQARAAACSGEKNGLCPGQREKMPFSNCRDLRHSHPPHPARPRTSYPQPHPLCQPGTRFVQQSTTRTTMGKSSSHRCCAFTCAARRCPRLLCQPPSCAHSRARSCLLDRPRGYFFLPLIIGPC